MKRFVLVLVTGVMIATTGFSAAANIWSDDALKCGIFAMQCGGRAFRSSRRGPAPYRGILYTYRGRAMSGYHMLTRR